jgi:predicted ATPase/DNA-binding CsgD family transcriptional regulator
MTPVWGSTVSAPSLPDAAGMQPKAPVPLARLERHPRGELPLSLTSFVGREHEIATAAKTLRQDGVRLLTLTGPGGVGKTRLALRIAEELEGDFPDGVWFVPLAPVRDPALVAATVATTLGVREARGHPLVAALQIYLLDKRALILLDNFEHVLEAAPLVTDLLSTCPQLTVLGTSRTTLRLSGEHDLAVPPFAAPDLGRLPSLEALSNEPAVRLFIDRAHAARDDFALNTDNATTVAQICQRLDGLPLAIELAAARSKFLPPQALLDRLEQRLPLLTGGPRDAPARLRTMRDAIAWSHDLLSEEEQTLFRRLAVFAGGFTLEAAEAVTGEPGVDVFAGVEVLVDQSLVRRLDIVADEEPRFGMLETVREFGLERLKASGEEQSIRERHATYFLALAEAAEPQLRGSAQDRWLDRLQTAHDDLRAALRWSLTADTEMALRLAGDLHWFWYLRGHWSEGRSWLEDALVGGGSEARTPARMKALAGAGILAFTVNDGGSARARLEESTAIGRELADPAGTAYGLHFLEMGAFYFGERAVARNLSESIDLFRSAGDTWGLATALCSRGISAILLGDPAASALIEESLALAHELGDAWLLARTLNYAGELARLAGDAGRARTYYEESLALYRKLGHWEGTTRELLNLGYAVQHLGDPRRAAECFAEALPVGREHGDRWHVAHYIAALAGTALALGDPRIAARLLGAGSGLIEAIGHVPWPVDQVEHDRDLAAARAHLGEEAVAAWTEGRALSLEQALAEAAEVASAGISMLPRSSPSGSAAGGLTPREREVLGLLVEGKSDLQIANTLSISRRTAATHVAHIYRKLDVNSRAEAAAYAVRHGLA